MKKFLGVAFALIAFTNVALAQFNGGPGGGPGPVPDPWTVNGSTLEALNSGLLIGNATGGGEGAGTINASVGYFINGVPISQASGITVGSTPILGGGAVPNGLLFDNAGTLGNLATIDNGVLVTSAAGAPSISTTLPSSLTIPSPTLTGTVGGTAVIPNAALVNASTTVNGQSCALGGNCTISASAGTVTIGTTVVSGGPGVLYNATSGGTLDALAAVNNAVLSFSGAGALQASTTLPSALAATDMTLTTPTISGALTYGGVALAASVTGTGPMVLGTSPSIGSLTVTGSLTATGLVTYADMASAAIASAANYFSGASNVLVPASVIYQGEVAVTFSATPTFDLTTFVNAAITLTGNITTMNVTALAGKSGQIRFIQDATGSRTTVWNSVFKFAGGVTPSLSTAANAIDVLFYSCVSTSLCYASLVQNMK